MRSIHVAIAYSNERIDLFLAQGLTHHGASLDAEEFLEVLHVPVAQALAWLADGTITDVKTIIGLMMLEQRLNKVQGAR